MKDETYVFIKDSMDKKTIGRSAFNKRSHAGGSGKKKWAAEYMTNKELAKMNGELKTYRLNDPMTWAEFKALPDDIKKMYIKGIQERYNPFDKAIAEMMGIHFSCLSVELKRLGINRGQNGGRREWDKEGFEAWARGEKPTEAYQSLPKPTEEAVTEVTEVTEETEVTEVIEEPKVVEKAMKPITAGSYTEVAFKVNNKKKAVPMTGQMRFEGKTEDILETIASVLGGAEVKLTISWGVMVGDEE